MRRRGGVAAVAVAALAVAGGCGAGEDDADGAAGARRGAVVVRVIDGDTVRVRVDGVETSVRLLGIDTPEVARPDTPVQCFGPEASRRARELLPPGSAVTVETDPTQDRRDRFGRLLAYVYAPGGADARGSVNYRLVASGHARAYVYDRAPFRHAEAFRAAERRARGEGAGLWGPRCGGGRAATTTG